MNVSTVNTKIMYLYAQLEKGGMQKMGANLTCSLPSHYEQYIAFFETQNPGFDFHAEMVDMNVPGSMQMGPIRKFANFLLRLHRLQRFIDTHKIDIVVSFGEAANVLNCLTKRKRKLLTVHVSLEEGLAQAGDYGPIYRRLMPPLYRRAERVIPCSQAIARQLHTQLHIPNEKLTVILPFYDPDLLRKAKEPLPERWEAVFAKPTVISVGSLIHQKGHEFLLRGFAHAYAVRPELQLVLVGRGDLTEELHAQARSLGIERNVHFVGFDSNPYRYMARASLFALTSRFEGFPAVLIEAMVCGLPVIATDCNTGPREILGDSEYGLLLPDIQPENQQHVERELGESMRKLLEPAEATRYRELSLQRSQLFSRECTIGNWLDVLEFQGELDEAKIPSVQ